MDWWMVDWWKTSVRAKGKTKCKNEKAPGPLRAWSYLLRLSYFLRHLLLQHEEALWQRWINRIGVVEIAAAVK